jgi:ketosteroid isomerase-like protein
MAENETRSVMEAYLGALGGGEDFSRYFSPDVVWTFMESGDQVHGRDAVRDVIVAAHRTSFDAHPELRGLVVGDGTAMLEAVFIGRHTGEYMGVPPTGLDVRRPYCMAYDVAGGSITALRSYFPTVSLVAELTEAARSAASAHV